MSSTQYILCKGSKDTTFIISIGMCWWLRCRHHWDLGVTVLCRQMFIVGDAITELVFLIPMGCWNYRIIVGRWQFKCIQCTRLTESSVCVCVCVCVCACACAQLLNCVQLFASPPLNFPGKNTGAGCHILLQGIFLTQGSNLHLLVSCIDRWILYH